MSKINLLIIASILLLVSCGKEDENPYENNGDNNPTTQKSYFMTDADKKFVMYQVADSFKMKTRDDDTIYYEVKSIEYDTLKNSENKDYEQILIRFYEVFPEYQYFKAEKGFIWMTRRTGSLEYYLTLGHMFDEYEDKYESKTIPYSIQENYTTKSLNGKTYTNVYRVEQDSSNNQLGICFIKRAYISSDIGIIDIATGCGHMYLID